MASPREIDIRPLATSSTRTRTRRRVHVEPEERVAILAAFYQDKPAPKDLVAWCRTKAEEFNCPSWQLSELVGELTLYLEREVQMLLGNDAEKFAASAGLTLTRALKRLNQLVDAKKVVFRSMGSGQPSQVVEVEDNQIRLQAVEMALTYFGRMEQRFNVNHQHDHEHRHLVMNLTDDQLLAQIRDLHSKTEMMLENHGPKAYPGHNVPLPVEKLEVIDLSTPASGSTSDNNNNHK